MKLLYLISCSDYEKAAYEGNRKMFDLFLWYLGKETYFKKTLAHAVYDLLLLRREL